MWNKIEQDEVRQKCFVNLQGEFGIRGSTRNYLLKSRRAHQLLDNQRAALEDAVRDRTAELRATVAQLHKTNWLPS